MRLGPLFVSVALVVLPATHLPAQSGSGTGSSTTTASDPVGRVTAAFGVAAVYTPDGVRKGDLHTMIANGDRIRTNGGGVTVLLASRVVLKIDHDTTVTVNESPDQTNLVLERGTVHVFVGQRPLASGAVCVQDPQARVETEQGVFLASYDPSTKQGYYACEHATATVEPAGKWAIPLAPDKQIVIADGEVGEVEELDRMAFQNHKQSLERLGQSVKHQGVETFRMRTRLFDTQLAINQLTEAGWISSEMLQQTAAQQAASKKSSKKNKNSSDSSSESSDEESNKSDRRNNKPAAPDRNETPDNDDAPVAVVENSEPASGDMPDTAPEPVAVLDTTDSSVSQTTENPVPVELPVTIETPTGSNDQPGERLGNLPSDNVKPDKVKPDKGGSGRPIEVPLDLGGDGNNGNGGGQGHAPPPAPVAIDTPISDTPAPGKVDLDLSLPTGDNRPTLDLGDTPAPAKLELDNNSGSGSGGGGNVETIKPKFDLGGGGSSGPGKAQKLDKIEKFDNKGHAPKIDLNPADSSAPSTPKLDLDLPKDAPAPKLDLDLPQDAPAPKLNLDLPKDAPAPKFDLKVRNEATPAPKLDLDGTKGMTTAPPPAKIDLALPQDIGAPTGTGGITLDVPTDMTQAPKVDLDVKGAGDIVPKLDGVETKSNKGSKPKLPKLKLDNRGRGGKHDKVAKDLPAKVDVAPAKTDVPLPADVKPQAPIDPAAVDALKDALKDVVPAPDAPKDALDIPTPVEVGVDAATDAAKDAADAVKDVVNDAVKDAADKTGATGTSSGTSSGTSGGTSGTSGGG